MSMLLLLLLLCRIFSLRTREAYPCCGCWGFRIISCCTRMIPVQDTRSHDIPTGGLPRCQTGGGPSFFFAPARFVFVPARFVSAGISPIKPSPEKGLGNGNGHGYGRASLGAGGNGGAPGGALGAGGALPRPGQVRRFFFFTYFLFLGSGAFCGVDDVACVVESLGLACFFGEMFGARGRCGQRTAFRCGCRDRFFPSVPDEVVAKACRALAVLRRQLFSGLENKASCTRLSTR